MTTKASPELNLQRLGEEIDMILTEIYGEYVAEGSPTKLGGLRFLDVPSAKTFAFEKTQPLDEGNLLIVSAPSVGDQKTVEKQMKSGPHSKSYKEMVVRTSSDAGKGGKYFLEFGYRLPTIKWLTDEAITKMAETEGCNGNEAVRLLLKKDVLPIARDVMAHFIQVIREHSKEDAIL